MATRRKKVNAPAEVLEVEDAQQELEIVQIKPSPQALLMRRLISSIPLNDYALPLCLYRIDLLPRPNEEGEIVREQLNEPISEPLSESGSGQVDAVYNDDSMTLVDRGDGSMQLEYRVPEVTLGLPNASELAAAAVEIEFDEAYPTLTDGRPIWMQFDFEVLAANKAFEAYLMMPEADDDGIRRLIDVPEALKAQGLTCTLWQVKDWYYIYFWAWRVKAYDLFRAAQRVKEQRNRAIRVVDEHWSMSNKMMTKLRGFMEDDETFWELMTPIVAVNLLRELIKVQRLSAGLPSTAPESTGSTGRGQSDSGGGLQGGESMEEIYRKFANRSSTTRSIVEDEEQSAIDKAMSDKDTFEAAQELVFKLLDRPHHKERQQAVLRAPQIINDDPNQASES